MDFVSWLSLRCSANKEDREKHQCGIVPFNIFEFKPTKLNFERLPVSIGIGPTNLLNDKSKKES